MLIPPGLFAITQGFNDLIAYEQSNGTIIEANTLDIIQESQYWEFNDAINECYNNKLSEKAKKTIIQIKR